jgi:hypothetical protein
MREIGCKELHIVYIRYQKRVCRTFMVSIFQVSPLSVVLRAVASTRSVARVFAKLMSGEARRMVVFVYSEIISGIEYRKSNLLCAFTKPWQAESWHSIAVPQPFAFPEAAMFSTSSA